MSATSRIDSGILFCKMHLRVMEELGLKSPQGPTIQVRRVEKNEVMLPER